MVAFLISCILIHELTARAAIFALETDGRSLYAENIYLYPQNKHLYFQEYNVCVSPTQVDH